MGVSGRSGAGSSPLTRGKLVSSVGNPIQRGLIPAHAGKTGSAFGVVVTFGAHPRSRGENVRTHARASWLLGSSPLTRGKLLALSPNENGDRLIPAHAGKTFRGGGQSDSSAAHPRSRGENGQGGDYGCGHGGSSPLTRGKPNDVDGLHVGPGLIPAHAGKTPTSKTTTHRPWAHPRSRGENANQDGATFLNQGSSPITRGKPRRWLQSVP